MKALFIELCVWMLSLCLDLYSCISFCASQEAPLHKELHPHASVCVIYPEGHRSVHQGCCPLRGRGGGQLLLRLCELIIQDAAVYCGCFERNDSGILGVLEPRRSQTL